MDKALQLIGIARLSGNLSLGEENAGALVKAGKARLLLLAADASEGTKKRARASLEGFRTIAAELPYTKAELGAATGRSQCAAAAVRDLGLAAAIARALAETDEAFLPIAQALEEKQARQQRRKAAKGGKTGKRRKRL